MPLKQTTTPTPDTEVVGARPEHVNAPIFRWTAKERKDTRKINRIVGLMRGTRQEKKNVTNCKNVGCYGLASISYRVLTRGLRVTAITSIAYCKAPPSFTISSLENSRYATSYLPTWTLTRENYRCLGRRSADET